MSARRFLHSRCFEVYAPIQISAIRTDVTTGYRAQRVDHKLSEVTEIEIGGIAEELNFALGASIVEFD